MVHGNKLAKIRGMGLNLGRIVGWNKNMCMVVHQKNLRIFRNFENFSGFYKIFQAFSEKQIKIR